MNTLFAYIVSLLNVPTNALGKYLLGPIAVLPGWLSNTIVAAITGVVLLLLFKYASNQRAIGRIRNSIKANTLTLKLFKDCGSVSVMLKARGGALGGLLLLLLHAIRPMLVMILPVSLLLGQLALWYQRRPLRVGDYSVVTMKLNGSMDSSFPAVDVESPGGAQVTIGPVRILSKREICWEIKARQNGSRPIVFQVNQQRIEKELAIGEKFMRVSPKRPGWSWTDILVHPAEKPFDPDSSVTSITVEYPDRLSKISGTDWWMVYFFGASLFFAFLFRRSLNVKV